MGGNDTHFWKCLCFAPLNFAEQGERTLSVGETIDLQDQQMARISTTIVLSLADRLGEHHGETPEHYSTDFTGSTVDDECGDARCWKNAAVFEVDRDTYPILAPFPPNNPFFWRNIGTG